MFFFSSLRDKGMALLTTHGENTEKVLNKLLPKKAKVIASIPKYSDIARERPPRNQRNLQRGVDKRKRKKNNTRKGLLKFKCTRKFSESHVTK